MRRYKFGKLGVTTENKDEAKQIADFVINGNTPSDRCIIIVHEDGFIQPIAIPEKKCIVYTKLRDEVTKVGCLAGGEGEKVITAAIKQMDESAKQSAKFAAYKKRQKFLEKEDDYKRVINDFESLIPERQKWLFDDVIQKLCGSSLTYRVEIYNMINDNIRPGNWYSILNWFTNTILSKGVDCDKHVLRKSFITTVNRIGVQDSKIANVMDDVAKVDTGEWWKKYASEKSDRSKKDT